MNITKQRAQQLILQPVVLQYNHTLSITQKIAGSFLVLFFLMLGSSIFFAGFKAEEYRTYYFLFGIILCSFPFIIYLLIQNSKNKLITLIDKDGLILKNNKKFIWENLQSIMHHASAYAAEDTYYSVNFKFTNGEAVATCNADNFSFVLYIAGRLPIPNRE